MAEPKKDTIYIDIDDEITGIIDKVRGSGAQVTALVLPKRAGVFQSIVNMKLLKRAADEANKKLVLITSEAGLLPLAGAAGIHVAKTLSSKPEIPMAPKLDNTGEESIDEAGNIQPATKETAGQQPVGKLAAPPPEDNGVETLQLDDDELPEDAATKASAAAKKAAPAAAAAKAAKDKGKKSGKGFKIPNFGKFRKKLIFGGIILLLLIIGVILAAVVLPKATINIKTDAQNIPVSLNLNLSTTADQLDDSSDTPTLPAKLASEQKTYSQQVPTTGQENHGNKANGHITMTAQECAPNLGTPSSVPAGTGVTANGNTYITQSVTTFSSQPTPGNGSCNNYSATGSTAISAQSGGSSYNTGNGSSFGVSGRSDVSATGSANGGTDNIVKVVNQNDVDKAKSQIATNDGVEKQSLKDQLKQDGYYAIVPTFSSRTPNTTESAQVGDVANSVTVTEVITYTMFGTKEKDLNTVIDNAVKNQVDISKQTILDRGLGQAVFGVNTANSSGAQLTLQTKAEVGPDLDINAIKKSALGKKPGDVRAQIETNPDVISVRVNLSPFWVSSIPNKASKVTVKIAKPDTTKSSNDGGSQ